MHGFSSNSRPKDKMEEKKLVSQILLGNELALRKFWRYYYPRLSTFIKNRIENPSDCEEILQDVLLATLEKLRDFRFECALFTFICSIASHKVIDYYRRKKIKSIVFSRLTGFESWLSTLFGPEEAFDEELLKDKIKNTFAKISPVYARILKLKYIYGFSVSEIARKMSITFKSAESQLFRARKAFASVFSL